MGKPYKVIELLLINNPKPINTLKPIKVKGPYDKLFIGKYEGRPCYMERNGSKRKFYRLTQPPVRWQEAKPWSGEAAKAAKNMSANELYDELMRTQGPEVMFREKTSTRKKRTPKEVKRDRKQSDGDLAVQTTEQKVSGNKE